MTQLAYSLRTQKRTLLAPKQLTEYIRHVYANPLNPWICPVLSLSRFLISFPGKSDTGPLFEGSSQYDRFRANLQEIVMEHAEEILAMGVEPENIGVHSIRKGAATYCTSGTTTGVSFAALCVRAGWSMGGVKDRYIKYAEAGDRFCGRTVAGLDVNSHEFSVSPPLIDASSKEHEGDILQAKGILFGLTGAKWGLLLRFLLASLLFHRDWMFSNIGSDFIHHCRFYDASTASEMLYVRLAAKAKICYPWTMKSEVSTGNHFPITGLPQAVIDFNYHREQLLVLRKLPEIIMKVLLLNLTSAVLVAENCH